MGVVISAVLATIAIILTIKQNRKKKLSYKVLYSGVLLNIDKQLQNDLKIVYKNQEVQLINLLKIEIINDGKVPIKKEEFEGYIDLELLNCDTVLDIEVTDSYPNNLKLTYDLVESLIVIHPLLINPGEYFKLKIIFDGKDSNFDLSARLEGISEIGKAVDSTGVRQYAIIVFLLITLFSGALIMYPKDGSKADFI